MPRNEYKYIHICMSMYVYLHQVEDTLFILLLKNTFCITLTIFDHTANGKVKMLYLTCYNQMPVILTRVEPRD